MCQGLVKHATQQNISLIGLEKVRELDDWLASLSGRVQSLSQDRLHKQSSDWCSGAAHAQTHAYNNFDTGKINK